MSAQFIRKEHGIYDEKICDNMGKCNFDRGQETGELREGSDVALPHPSNV